MRTLHALIATLFVLLQLQATAQAAIIYQNEFSGTLTPGSSRTTVGDPDFHQIWSITPTLESQSGNQYARFDISIPTLPDSADVRWYGGFFANASSMTALPAEWQLSFDISVSFVEPFEVSIELEQGRSVPPLPPLPSRTMTYWVQPSDVGWQRIVIDQNTDYLLEESFSGPTAGTRLRVRLASHDIDGNPLTISQIGTHDFLLDNVLLQSVPEPYTLSFCGTAAVLFAGLRRYRTKPALGDS